MFKMELINNMIGIFAMKMEFIQKCQYAIVAATVIQCFNNSNTMLWNGLLRRKLYMYQMHTPFNALHFKSTTKIRRSQIFSISGQRRHYLWSRVFQARRAQQIRLDNMKYIRMHSNG